MKNTSEESFFKKKGFFVALYSTLGAVMVLALVITFTNLMTGPAESELAEQVTEDTVNVGADGVDSYLESQAALEAQDNETAWWRSTPKPTQAPPQPLPTPSVPASQPAVTPPPPAPRVSAQPEAVSPDASGTAPAVPPEATPAAPDKPAASDVPAAVDVQEPAAPSAVELPAADADVPVVETPAEQPAANSLAFTPFSENDRMIWPVEGEIAKMFSGNKLIYDPTYDKYAVNDDIRISAQEGTPVKAAAGGQVVEIGYSMEDGNYVTIDHGNGYSATYGQLMEAVLVAQGEVVSAGQYIGGVGEPSPGGSLNGTHVNLRVAKEDVAIDPMTLLTVNE